MMLAESMERVTYTVNVYFCIPEIIFFVSPCHDALVIIWRMIHFMTYIHKCYIHIITNLKYFSFKKCNSNGYSTKRHSMERK